MHKGSRVARASGQAGSYMSVLVDMVGDASEEFGVRQNHGGRHYSLH